MKRKTPSKDSDSPKKKSMKKKVLTDFERKVYAIAKQIPKGQVTTYKLLAEAIDGTGASSRAVGNALRRNPYAPMVPCHRIVKTDFGLGGFQGKTDPETTELCRKNDLLKLEGIRLEGNGIAKGKTYREQVLADLSGIKLSEKALTDADLKNETDNCPAYRDLKYWPKVLT